MPERKKKQTTLIIAVVILAVFAVVGVFGYRILNGSVYDPDAGSSTIRIKQYVDTSKLYQLDYPASFSFEQAADCCEGAPKNWSQVSRPVSFRAANYPGEHSFDVQADSTSALGVSIASNWQSNFHTPSQTTINGRPAQYVRVDYRGDNESYVDHNYLISATTGGSVFVSYRENYAMGESSWDARGNLPVLEAMVMSIKIL